ncbi:MAG: DUF4097 family beta strand repeat-containing protein [Chryseolinea sp.]
MKTIITLLSFILLSVTLSNAQEAKYSFSESFKLTSPTQVSVSSSDGNIEAVAVEGQKADVFYIVTKNNKVLNISRAELEKEVTLEVIQVNNSLSIVVKYKDEYNKFSWKDKMVVNFRLQLPKDAANELRTSDGNISIKGFTKDQKCKTSDGNLNITDIVGSVVASTSDGNINVNNVTGSVEVKSSDGNIVIDNVKGDTKIGTSDGNLVLNNISGNTVAKTSDGDIKFENIAGSLTASTSDGNVSGNMLALSKELTVRTGDGNIAVTIPGNLGLDLDIKGESLDIPLTNFSGRSDENVIVGKSNGGGIPVNLSTSGNVKLSYK